MEKQAGMLFKEEPLRSYKKYKVRILTLLVCLFMRFTMR